MHGHKYESGRIMPAPFFAVRCRGLEDDPENESRNELGRLGVWIHVGMLEWQGWVFLCAPLSDINQNGTLTTFCLLSSVRYLS